MVCVLPILLILFLVVLILSPFNRLAGMYRMVLYTVVLALFLIVIAFIRLDEIHQFIFHSDQSVVVFAGGAFLLSGEGKESGYAIGRELE